MAVRRELTVRSGTQRDYPAIPLFRKHIVCTRVRLCDVETAANCHLHATFIRICVRSVSHHRTLALVTTQF